MQTPEGRIKDAVCRYLKSLGVWHFRAFMSGYGKSGIPDIVCCFRGRFLSIEVKREGCAPTPRQVLRMDEIRRAGGAAIWGDSVDGIVEQIKTVFGLDD